MSKHLRISDIEKTLPRKAYLYLVANADPNGVIAKLSMAELADYAGFSVSNVDTILNELSELGILMITRSNRSRRIQITCDSTSDLQEANTFVNAERSRVSLLRTKRTQFRNDLQTQDDPPHPNEPAGPYEILKLTQLGERYRFDLQIRNVGTIKNCSYAKRNGKEYIDGPARPINAAAKQYETLAIFEDAVKDAVREIVREAIQQNRFLAGRTAPSNYPAKTSTTP